MSIGPEPDFNGTLVSASECNTCSGSGSGSNGAASAAGDNNYAGSGNITVGSPASLSQDGS